MLNSPETNHDEAGFTLLEMTVTMSLFGMLTVMVFNLWNTASTVQANASASLDKSIDLQPALNAVAKEVRNSPESRISEDGETLYLLTQADVVTVWQVTANGLSNGTRTYEAVTEARFENVDGVIETTLIHESGAERSFATGSRFEPSDESLTASDLQARGALSR
jgi:prepilin-type N-terminal cleavage/methylation domain-containing protein